AWHHRQFAIGLIEGDQRRVFLIEQEIRGIVESISISADTPPSRASPLPHFFCTIQNVKLPRRSAIASKG
ncbi:hypothetical protein ACQKP7_14300, partial [Pseudomonas frederiksbergensis]|uniref:hypothetical protein n=1 Tax=Pseudomonas frederiksbergensis TaxID=104087 RepID=UPI003CFC0D6C